MPEAPTSFGDGRYLVEGPLGSGGMGSVWLACDQSLERQVAIKVIKADLADDPETRTRFSNEIRALAKAEHPFVVPLHDFGFEDGRLFIVMALIKGKDLRNVASGDPLAPARALRLFQQTCQAAQAVHDRHIVHRDIKPANIMVADPGDTDEYAVLTDFGVARMAPNSNLTVGLPPLTPAYTAPEIWLGHAASPSSDQYALGCVLFEMLVGRPPFDADTPDAVRELHCHEQPPELDAFLPEAPPPLADALVRALAKEPADRFPSVREFAKAALSEPFPEEDPPPAEELRLQLSPSGSSAALFGLAPDRDERAPQLAMEMLLTLWANAYRPPEGRRIRGPKRRNGALRSLALGVNILEGLDDPGPSGHSPSWFGEQLASGADFGNSAHLGVAQRALRALLDPLTDQGSAGASLMLPIHESLLWFDARKSGAGGRRWAVRKVNMRGSGVTFARMLLDPAEGAGSATKDDARRAIELAAEALTAPSPFAALAERLESIAPEERGSEPEPAENIAWDAAERPELHELGRRIARHAKTVLGQSGPSPAARLLHLRSILALDLAHHLAVRSWETCATPPEQRFLLLSYAPEARRENRVRIASEVSYQGCRQYVVQALIATIARRATVLREHGADMHVQFEGRSGLEHIAEEMAATPPGDAQGFASLAGRAYEEAKGAGYGRSVEAFRVLLESLGLLRGTGAYRWLRAGPELLAGLVAAVADRPLEMPIFLHRLRDEWNLVIGDAESVGTALEGTLDGALLSRNARHLERTLVSSGLAQALSDQTCIVGQRLRDAS